MKRKIILSIATFILTFSLFATLPYIVKGDGILQDFDDYTYGYEANRVTIDAEDLYITNADRDEAWYVYKDFGENYFPSDENWYVDFKMTIDNYQLGVTYAVASVRTSDSYAYSPYTLDQSHQYNFVGAILNHAATNIYRVTVLESIAGVSDDNGSQGTMSNTWEDDTLYCQFWFDSEQGTYGRVYFDIYSDEAKTTRILRSYNDLGAERSWRYFAQTEGYNYTSGGYSGSGHIWDSYVQGGTILDVTTPETLENIAYDCNFNAIQVTANCTVDAGAQTPDYVFIAHTFDGETFYPHIGIPDGEGNYSAIFEIDGEYYGDNITWFAYAYLGETGYGESENHTQELIRTALSTPCVSTTAGIYVPSGGQNVELSGYLNDDGGETCNVSIRWHTYVEFDQGNYIYSGNTTANTGDDFSATVNLTVAGIWYEAQAVAINNQGTSYGQVVYFIRFDATTPEIQTLNPTGGTPLKQPDGTYFYHADFNATVTDDGDAWCYAGFEYKLHNSTQDWIRYLKGESFALETGDNVTVSVNSLIPGKMYDVRAIITNQSLQNPTTLEYTYIPGNTVVFATGAVSTGLLQITLDSVGYWDDYTFTWLATLVNDGGYECGVGIQYRTGGGAWILGNHGLHGVTTGQTVQSYQDGLNYGTVYEVRAYALSGLNETAYSNIIEYQLKAPGDTETPTPGPDISKPIDDLLINYGLYNDGGKLLVVIAAMLFVVCLLVFIPGNSWREHLNVTLPIAGVIDALILIFGMIINYVPVWMTVIVVVVFAGVVAYFVTRIFGARQGS